MLRFVIIGLVLFTGTGSVEAAAVHERLNSVTSVSATGLTEAQKIERLIQFVRGMKDATFIRNGSEHSCREAAEHLQSKWQKHKDKIGSARDFIDELASKSGLSGQPYKIRFKDGSVLTTYEVLTRELQRLESL